MANDRIVAVEAHRRGFPDADFLEDEVLDESGQLLIGRWPLARAGEARRELTDACLRHDDPAGIAAGRVSSPEPDGEERGPEDQEVKQRLVENLLHSKARVPRAAGAAAGRRPFAQKIWTTMSTIPRSRRMSRRMSPRRSSTVRFASDTLKQPQSIAFPRARFREIAPRKTTKERADEARRHARPDAEDEGEADEELDPRHDERHEVHERARHEPVVVDHVREGRRVDELRQRRGDEEKPSAIWTRTVSQGEASLLRRHDSGPVALLPPRLTQSGQPSGTRGDC